MPACHMQHMPTLLHVSAWLQDWMQPACSNSREHLATCGSLITVTMCNTRPSMDSLPQEVPVKVDLGIYTCINTDSAPQRKNMSAHLL